MLAVAVALLACDPVETRPDAPAGPTTEPPAAVEEEPGFQPPDLDAVEAAFVPDDDCFGIEPRGPDADELTCGTVAVPLRHDDPDGAAVTLPVLRIPGTAADAYDLPLLLLGGGPGENAVEAALTEPLLRELVGVGPDLIVIDQRGAGLSDPALDCPDLPEMGQATAAEDVTEALAGLARCQAELRADGIDLDAFHHLANAADVGIVARALGHDRIDLSGTSYGTQVALLAAELYPDLVRAVVLSSPVDPTINWIEGTGAGIERAFDRLAEACVHDASCAEDLGDLEVAIQDTVDRLASEPEEITVEPPGYEATTTRYEPSTFLSALSLLFYLPDGVGALPAFVRSAADGDLTPVAEIAAIVEQELEDLISVGMYMSMLCTGEAALADPDRIAAGLSTARFREHWFPFALVGGAPTPEACDAWDVTPSYDPAAVRLESQTPTLIVTGGFDHVTPPAYGRQLDEQLAASHLVEVAPVGHAALEALGACGQRLVGDFLADPDVRPDDRCVDERSLRLITRLGPAG